MRGDQRNMYKMLAHTAHLIPPTTNPARPRAQSYPLHHQTSGPVSEQQRRRPRRRVKPPRRPCRLVVERTAARVGVQKPTRCRQQGGKFLWTVRCSADCASARAEGAEMEGLTSSEIAGFVVGALLLGATIAAPKVDGFIASSQRRSLGMCKRCGDLRIVACSQCKGTGSARNGGILNLGMLDDLYESLGAEAKTDNLVPCTKCRSRGRLLCPECSKVA